MMQEHLKSGRQAIRLLYFFIISMAITRALTNMYFPKEVYIHPSLDDYCYIIIFLSFLFRFCLASYRFLTQDIEREVIYIRVLLNTAVFILQAILFFIYSLYTKDALHTLNIIFIICLIDLFWLIVFKILGEISWKVFILFLAHDIVIMILIYFSIYHDSFYLNPSFPIIALLVSGIAFFVDILINLDFYFAHPQLGLKIYIALPKNLINSIKTRTESLEKAKLVAIKIAKRGHYPFIAQTKAYGWENDHELTEEQIYKIDLRCLLLSDAVFLLEKNHDMYHEKELAVSYGLRIFTNINQIEDITIIQKRPWYNLISRIWEKKMKIYFAGPLFTLAEKEFNINLVYEIRKLNPSINFILPQERAKKLSKHRNGLQLIYEDCIKMISEADIVLGILDGSDADSGTCIELGYASAKGKKIIGIRTDFRASEDNGLNIMVSKICTKLIINLESNSKQLAKLIYKEIKSIS
jgi:nucleoside 2-deoxyribosyltransferase